jgi:hypothetical protein
MASRELWRLAGAQGVELRRLTSSRNSLEQLFLKAMEESVRTDGASGKTEAPRAGL